jgi:hypothetical protein
MFIRFLKLFLFLPIIILIILSVFAIPISYIIYDDGLHITNALTELLEAWYD